MSDTFPDPDLIPASLNARVLHALSPAHWFTVRPLSLRVDFVPTATIAWEIFQGHLLGATATRQTRQFSTWYVRPNTIPAELEAAVPDALVSLHWDRTSQTLFVVRYLLVEGWETYEPTPGVIASRPARKNLAELVASIRVESSAPETDLEREIHQSLRLAFTGVSRLPIVSLESPHPLFSYGWCCAGLTRDSDTQEVREPLSLWNSELRRASGDVDRVRPWILEFVLRAVSHSAVEELAQSLFAQIPDPHNNVPRLLRAVFQSVSLTPMTDFLTKFLHVIDNLALPQCLGVEPMVDLVGYMLRYLVRHLTAYDLHRFHSFGANYPDAIFLDELLQRLATWASHSPRTFAGDDRRARLRRRAVRSGWITRTHYEGLPVPDHPTSQGENQRVLPGAAPIPEEQITRPKARGKKLFDGRPAAPWFVGHALQVLQDAIRDLQDPDERAELGRAIYLDRPLGILKPPGAVDKTPLIAHVAYSDLIAAARWKQLQAQGWLPGQAWCSPPQVLVGGIPAAQYATTARPGVVSLGDARIAADDFCWLSTTRSSRQLLVERLLPDATDLSANESGLLLRTADSQAAWRGEPFLIWFDRQWREVARWAVAIPPGQAEEPVYRECGGQEQFAVPLRRL